MKLRRRVLAIAMACCISSAQAVQPPDIVLTPLARGGVSVTDATGTVIRLRIDEDGSLTIPGSIFKGSNRFIHTFGAGNTFIGELAGNFMTTGANNTGTGLTALAANTTGGANTAIGSSTLGFNTTGSNNTASGVLALGFNTAGSDNTANGVGALVQNTIGNLNVAVGRDALKENRNGSANTVLGTGAATGNTTGSQNTAVGVNALRENVDGNYNIAVGNGAGSFLTGSRNIAIGSLGSPNDDGTIRLGSVSDHNRAFIAGIRGTTVASAIPVMIDSLGQLGTVNSSARFKDDIADMASATDALMQLRPVTFHYKEDQDPAGRTLQYGLIAEEVAQVYPGLIAHSADGQVETVMHQFLPPMLLNEFQKQQRTIAAQSERLASQAARLDALEGELAEFRRMLGRPR